MNDRQFDKIIKDRIEKYDSVIPSGMWERVSPQDKRRRRIFVWWWWAIPGAALIAGAYLLLPFDKKEERKVENIVVNKENVEPLHESAAPTEKSKQSITTRDHVTYLRNFPATQYQQSQSHLILETGSRLLIKPFPSVSFSNEKPSISLADVSASNRFTNFDSGLSKIPCPVWKKINPWFAEVFTGPAVGFKNSGGTLILQPGTYATHLSIRSGIYVGKYLSERFYLKSGFSLTSFRDKVRGDSVVYLERNSYNVIDIPLIAGYALNKQKLKVNLQTGALFMVHSWHKGFNRPEHYKTTAVSAFGSVNLMYPVGEKIQVFAEPYYIRQLTDITRPTWSNQKMHQAGLSIGARYTIPNRQHY